MPERPVRVLDVAAGTGKLTAALLGRGHRVLAVEPLAGMLAELHRRHPSAAAVAGTAELLPIGHSCIDAVTVAQAFHWFDQRRALDEMARVLRPGGTLALVWNHDDERDPMVRDVQAALDRTGRPAGGSTGRGRGRDAADGGGTAHNGTTQGAGDQSGRTEWSAQRDPAIARSPWTDPTRGDPPRVPPFDDHPYLTDPELIETTWQRRMSTDDFIALQHTYSYVILASDEVRNRLDAELRNIVRSHAGGADTLTLPVTCQVWRPVRR